MHQCWLYVCVTSDLQKKIKKKVLKQFLNREILTSFWAFFVKDIYYFMRILSKNYRKNDFLLYHDKLDRKYFSQEK